MKYKHLVEKPSFCGPACLQMILLRRGIWIDQEEIAKEIGARILPKEKDFFTIKFPISANDAGINLVEFDTKKVKKFFKKYKLKLTTEVVHISKIKDCKTFIKKHLAKGNDLMANFHMSYYKKSKNWGHFNLIDKIQGNIVTFCDPWPSNKSFWKTTIADLIASMNKKFDGKERGFVVFS